MHSPNTAPTKVAGPFPAATEPHQTPQQLQATRGHVLGAAGASEAADDGRRGGTSTSRAPAEPPPLATFWTPTHPHTGLQAPPEPPATEGSEQARGGRDWGRCWCIFAHVAAAATRARTHGSLWHIFSTVLAISEVLKPLRAPLARGFGAGGMTPEPLRGRLSLGPRDPLSRTLSSAERGKDTSAAGWGAWPAGYGLCSRCSGRVWETAVWPGSGRVRRRGPGARAPRL